MKNPVFQRHVLQKAGSVQRRGYLQLNPLICIYPKVTLRKKKSSKIREGREGNLMSPL